jgi:hypothetical protein
LKFEEESMSDAVRFAQLCHEAGLHVGVYNYSGAFLWEPFFKEVPQAKNWVIWDEDGKPVIYDRAGYRYYWNRNHPEAQAFYRELVRFAVKDIRADLIHFDNYVVGPGRDANSTERFRTYLRETFAPEQLKQAGMGDLARVEPPQENSPVFLQRAWLDFSCQSLADSYGAMNRFARSLRPDVLVECNPNGIDPCIRAPVDHGRILQGGEAFWDEIRTFKVARAMDNMAFCYITTPLEAAESMAFNLDCLGAICWFEYGQIVEQPGSSKPVGPKLEPFVRFYRAHHDLFRNSRVVADVAVLRSFPSQVFGGTMGNLTARVEDALIRSGACFQILHDHQLDQLQRYRILILAGCLALSDQQIAVIRRYVASGGRLGVIGPVATHDQWMSPRRRPALDDLSPDRVVRIDDKEDPLMEIRRACGGWLSLSLQAKVREGLGAELTEQPGRRLVHLVNYRGDGPLQDISVRLRLPEGKRVRQVTLASPERDDRLSVPFQEEAGGLRFTVPRVGVYEIAIVTMDPLDSKQGRPEPNLR